MPALLKEGQWEILIESFVSDNVLGRVNLAQHHLLHIALDHFVKEDKDTTSGENHRLTPAPVLFQIIFKANNGDVRDESVLVVPEIQTQYTSSDGQLHPFAVFFNIYLLALIRIFRHLVCLRAQCFLKVYLVLIIHPKIVDKNVKDLVHDMLRQIHFHQS